MIFLGTVIVCLIGLEIVFKYFSKRETLHGLNIKDQLLLSGIIFILSCDILLRSGVKAVYICVLVAAFLGLGLLVRRVARWI